MGEHIPAPAGEREARLTDEQIEQACEVMHDAYEAAAAEQGWETQQRSRKPWSDVPEANRATMRVAVRAVADRLVAPLKARLAEVEAERDEWRAKARMIRVEVHREIDKPTTARIWMHGALVFDGQTWDAALRAEADLAAAEQRGGAVLAAAHDAADELDVWDGYPSATLDGCSPGGVVRHAVHEANGTDIDNCPACADRLATQATNDNEEGAAS